MIDLAAELIAALRSPSGRGALREALEPMVRDVVTAALLDQRETPKPLAEILGIGADAARKREARDPELKKLAIKSGRRRLYKTNDVIEHLRKKSA